MSYVTYTCLQCGDLIFVIDVTEEDGPIWTHLTETHCDDPVPDRGKET